MDNATIHKSKKIKSLLAALFIYYCPPYSPFNNPIEEFFALAKFRYRRQLCLGSDNLD